MTKRLTIVLGLLLTALIVNAQKGTLTGEVSTESGTVKISGAVAELRGTAMSTTTDEDGKFSIADIPYGNYTLHVIADGYLEFDQIVVIENETQSVQVPIISRRAADDMGNDAIPTITMSGGDDGLTDAAQNISGVLNASNDVFLNAASFALSSGRFEIRGYDQEYTGMYLNGVQMNDPETGNVFWSLWGGLNDVMRNRSASLGLTPLTYGFGEIGGGTSLDARAGSQRKQIRASYAVTNRTYRNRVMLTWNTGWMKGGWAVAVSASHRWADEGYVPGTFYNSWAYFASVEKRLGDNMRLALTFFGDPTTRGRAAAATDEMKGIAGTNYYNPAWGYQNGNKRNSRIARNHQPLAILNHEWNINERSTLVTGLSYQFGRNGTTRLEWYNAPDPRAEYYRRWPSFYNAEGYEEQALVAELALRNNESERQIDWDQMYYANRNSQQDFLDPYTGQVTATGNRARYYVAESRFDSKILRFNTTYTNAITDRFTMTAGLNYQMYTGNNFQVMDDLLGADYHVNIDRFLELINPNQPDTWQFDLENPNRIIREGDRMGYDYSTYIRNAGAWAQGQVTLAKFDFFLGGRLTSSSFWRKGNILDGLNGEGSFGESPKNSYLNYSVKGGLTYKFNGRNYFYGNAGYYTIAPYLRNSYTTAFKSNQTIDGLTDSKVLTAEWGYMMRSPNLKIRLSGYFTRFEDETDIRRGFTIAENSTTGENGAVGMANFIYTGINREHAGVEFAADVKVLTGLNLIAAGSVSRFIYTSRPDFTLRFDQTVNDVYANEKVYIKNYYVSNGPQTALTLGMRYSAPNFWFLNVNLNYYANNWLEFAFNRRTTAAVAVTGSATTNPTVQEESVTPGSTLWHQILDQPKAKPGATVDVFWSKSWKINKHFVYFNIGINNLLNNQNLITGGFEQLRLDFTDKEEFRKHPNMTFHGLGMTYFVSLATRL